MRHSSSYYALLVLFAVTMPFASLARADDTAWVSLGTVQTQDGSFEVFYDSSALSTKQNPKVVFDIKGIVTNQDFYKHSVDPRDIQSDVSDFEGGPIAAYFTEGIDVDCSARVVHVHHMIFRNPKDWWIADHDAKGDAIQPSQGTLGATVLQKVCGA